jgi:pyruvate kinase
MPRTKVIATYGPSLGTEYNLLGVLKHADIIRLNFSHGTLGEKAEAIRRIREAADGLDKDIAILADLPGPKIRVSNLEHPIHIMKGDNVAFNYKKRAAGKDIPIDLDIYEDVKKGSELYIGDGQPKLLVTGVSEGRIMCKALQDGEIGSRKGINVKGSSLSAEPPTGDDMDSAKFAMENNLDFIALSFVKSAANVKKIRKAAPGIGIISKIEREEAISNIESIANASDGIMIARGDMALNIDFSKVPLVQDRIIEVCRKAKKPVIVATQMLGSMTANQTPTRAEMTDVANAVKSGVDCVMLSDETAVGNYPVDTIQAMSNLLSYTEDEMPSQFNLKKQASSGHEGIALAAASISYTCDLHCIFVPTHSGATAKMLSNLRPESTIIALSESDKMRRSLALYYGIIGAKPKKEDGEGAPDVKAYARKFGIKSYMLVYGHKSNGSTSDAIRCFWGK